MKAGLIEIADIIVVNKADREGAEKLAGELRATLITNRVESGQSIITTQAINGIGIEELYEAIDQRRRKC